MSTTNTYIASVEDSNGEMRQVVVENAKDNTYAKQKATVAFRDKFGLNVKRNQVSAFKATVIS